MGIVLPRPRARRRRVGCIVGAGERGVSEGLGRRGWSARDSGGFDAEADVL